MGVGVDGIGPDIGFILLDKIQDVMSLPGAAGREAREQRDVGVSYEIIADAAVTAVANVVFRHQVLRIQFPLGTIRRGGFARAPNPLEGKLSIGVDDPCDGLVQALLGNVPLVNERHLSPVQPLDGARGLGRSQVAAIQKVVIR